MMKEPGIKTRNDALLLNRSWTTSLYASIGIVMATEKFLRLKCTSNVEYYTVKTSRQIQ